MNTLLKSFVGDAKLPFRTMKPAEGTRQNGITHVVDNGLSVKELEEKLSMYGAYVDSLEFESGTAFVTDIEVLKNKIACCRKYGVEPMFSALVYEKFAVHGEIDTYQQVCKELGITHFIIGDSFNHVPHYEKCVNIERFAKIGTVYGRVGTEDITHIIPPYKWIELMKAELEAGATRILGVGGRAGNIGLYRGSGEVREGLVQEIIAEIDPNKIIWDAPQRLQQVYYVELLYADVNLSGIQLQQVSYLESMRMGVDEKTFYLYIENK